MTTLAFPAWRKAVSIFFVQGKKDIKKGEKQRNGRKRLIYGAAASLILHRLQ